MRFIMIALMFFSFSSYSQNVEVVSEEFSNLQDTLSKVSQLDMFQQTYSIIKDKTSILESQYDIQSKISLLRILGTIEYYKNNAKDAIQNHKMASNLATKNGLNDSLVSLINREIAIAYFETFHIEINRKDSVLHYLDKSSIKGNQKNESIILLNKAIFLRDLTQSSIKNLKEAEILFKQSYDLRQKIYEEPAVYYRITNVLNELGELYIKWGLITNDISKYNLAITTLNKAKILMEKHELQKSSQYQEVVQRLMKVYLLKGEEFPNESNFIVTDTKYNGSFLIKAVNKRTYQQRMARLVIDLKNINNRANQNYQKLIYALIALLIFFILTIFFYKKEHDKNVKYQLSLQKNQELLSNNEDLIQKLKLSQENDQKTLIENQRLLSNNEDLIQKLKLIQKNEQKLLYLLTNTSSTSKKTRPQKLLEEYIPFTNAQLIPKFNHVALLIGLFDYKKQLITFPICIENGIKKDRKTKEIKKGITLNSIFFDNENADGFKIDNFQETYKEYIPQKETLIEEEQQNSIIYLPLRLNNEKPFGIISIQAKEANVFSKEDFNTMKTISKSLSMALWNAKLQDEQDLTSNIFKHRLENYKTFLRGTFNRISNRINTMNENQLRKSLNTLGGETQILINTLDGIQRWLEFNKSRSSLNVIEEEIIVNRINLIEITEKVFKQLQLAANLNRVSLINNVKDIRVQGNEIYVEEILTNIIMNAIQSFEHKPNSINNVVEVYLEENDDKTHFVCIKDNSGGIPKEIQRRLFKSTSYNKIKHSGFGNIICSILIDRMRQSIHIANSTKQGTIIKFTLSK